MRLAVLMLVLAFAGSLIPAGSAAVVVRTPVDDVEDEAWVAGNVVAQWLSWDLTELVGSWVAGEWPNDGVLLELTDGDEDFGTSGPPHAFDELPRQLVAPAPRDRVREPQRRAR